MSYYDKLVEWISVDYNYTGLFKYTKWRIEGYSLAPGITEDGEFMDSQTIPYDLENAAGNVIARAWQRIHRTRERRLFESFKAFGRNPEPYRAIWRQAVRAEVRFHHYQFGGTGSKQWSAVLFGEHEPPQQNDEQADAEWLLAMIEDAPELLAFYGTVRFGDVLNGGEPLTFGETAEVLGVSLRQAKYIGREFRELAELYHMAY